MKNKSLLSALLISLLTSVFSTGGAAAGTPQGLRWDPVQYGNQRYTIRVAQPADAVRVTLQWRRRDQHPEQIATIVVGPDGKVVNDVDRLHITQASSELAFKAVKAGTYAIYYLPYVSSGHRYYPTVVYRTPKDTASPAWLNQYHDFRDAKQVSALPQAQVLGYEAVDDFDAYTDMERTATPAEVARLLASNPGKPWLLFPEASDHPIRMFRQIPERWAQRGAGGALSDHALRGQYLAFQVGLWAARHAADDVHVAFSDLRGPDGQVIDASRLTCFNLGGTDYLGRPFKDRLDVAQGRVQPLWIGLDVPVAVTPGAYQGRITISSKGANSQVIPLSITIEPGQAVDHGYDDPHDFSRLNWFNSALAQDYSLVKPYTAVTVRGSKLGILGRTIQLASSGFPAQIDSYFDQRMTGYTTTPLQLLAAPVQLIVQDASGSHELASSRPPIVHVDGPGQVHWQVHADAGPLNGQIDANLEMDGTLDYSITLTARRTAKLEDIRLVIPLQSDAAQYEMGLGRQAGPAPANAEWKWNPEYNQDGAWIGTVNAGLEFELRGAHYRRPLNTNFYHLRPLRMPQSWANEGQGGIMLRRSGARYVVNAFSGSRTVTAGETLHYDIIFRVTPFKPIDPARHFANHYFQLGGSGKDTLSSIQGQGANVVNIHQGNLLNPWINYPYLTAPELKAYVDAAHRRDMSVKIYDTVRELSDHALELPMLESLTGCRIDAAGKAAEGPCSEVVVPGKGGGFSWLQEHLDGSYLPGWYTPPVRDAAIVDLGQSRWLNYYVEGLNWLAKHVGIDGIYLDDVAYDHRTIERVRKVLQHDRPHPMIDLHSANQFDPADGYANSALLYMGLFPYIDRLWFGERFDYENTSPGYWLTAMSGIPYGLMGEMLQGGGNPWRGMLFGMTARLPSESAELQSMWKVWKAFGIEKASMIGWWVRDAPVTTDRKDVLATSYVRKGQKTLIALASWAPGASKVRLHIDWKVLGLPAGTKTLVAPEITGFQPAAVFKTSQPIPVAPGKGWLLIAE